MFLILIQEESVHLYYPRNNWFKFQTSGFSTLVSVFHTNVHPLFYPLVHLHPKYLVLVFTVLNEPLCEISSKIIPTRKYSVLTSQYYLT